jgi:hypothetical protein
MENSLRRANAQMRSRLPSPCFLSFSHQKMSARPFIRLPKLNRKERPDFLPLSS